MHGMIATTVRSLRRNARPSSSLSSPSRSRKPAPQAHDARFFTWLADEELIPSNPMAGIKAVKLFRKPDQPRVRYFRPDEIKPSSGHLERQSDVARRSALPDGFRTPPPRGAAPSRERGRPVRVRRGVCRIPGSRMKRESSARRGAAVGVHADAQAPPRNTPPRRLRVLLRRRQAVDDTTAQAPPRRAVRVRDWQCMTSAGCSRRFTPSAQAAAAHRAATLAHVQPGVNQSYNKSTYLDERFEATRRYAEYLERGAGCSMMGCAIQRTSGSATRATPPDFRFKQQTVNFLLKTEPRSAMAGVFGSCRKIWEVTIPA